MAQDNKIVTLFNQYENVLNNLRKECERLIALHLKKAKEGITFKESVFLHFVSDNINTDLKRIDKDMILHADVHIDSGGVADVFEYGLEELDASSLYELLLALKEKRFVIA